MWLLISMYSLLLAFVVLHTSCILYLFNTILLPIKKKPFYKGPLMKSTPVDGNEVLHVVPIII